MGSLLISLLKFNTKNLASRDYNDADGKTMAIEKLTQQVNTLGRRSSENLLIKALIYFKAFEWRNSLLSMAESTFVCLLCDETLPIGRCMFFIKTLPTPMRRPMRVRTHCAVAVTNVTNGTIWWKYWCPGRSFIQSDPLFMVPTRWSLCRLKIGVPVGKYHCVVVRLTG